mgnify:CR=1 FL=1
MSMTNNWSCKDNRIMISPVFDGIFDERLYQHSRNLDRIRFDIIVYRQRVGEGETELFELQVELQLFDLVREGDQFLFGSRQHFPQQA